MLCAYSSCWLGTVTSDIYSMLFAHVHEVHTETESTNGNTNRWFWSMLLLPNEFE